MRKMAGMMGALLIGAMLTAVEQPDRSLALDLFKMKMAQNELNRTLAAEPSPAGRFTLSGKNELTLRSRSGGSGAAAISPQQMIVRLQLISEKMVIDPAVGIPDSMYAGGDAVSAPRSSTPQKPDMKRLRLQMGITSDTLIIDPAAGIPDSFYAEKEPAARPQDSAEQRMTGDPQRENLKKSSLDRVANRWGDGGNDAQYQGGARQGPKGGAARDDMGRSRIAPSQKTGAMDELMRDLRGRSLRGAAEQPSPYDDLR